MKDLYEADIRNFFADSVNDIMVDNSFRQCILPQGKLISAKPHVQEVRLKDVDVIKVRSVGKIVLVDENGQETVHTQKLVNGVFVDR